MTFGFLASNFDNNKSLSKNSIQNVELTKNNQCRITRTIKRHILLPMNVYEYKTTKLKAHLLQLCRTYFFSSATWSDRKGKKK